MSIDFLYDLERDVDNGREVFGCPGIGPKQWVFSRKGTEPLEKIAQRAANASKLPVDIVQLCPRHSVQSNKILVPTTISDAGPRGEPQVKWSIVESKEAAETLRDIRYGPAPYFLLEVISTCNPQSTD